MLALVEKLAGQGAATRQDVRKETAKPKPGRPEVVRLRVQAADEGLRPATELQEGARSRRPRSSRRSRTSSESCEAAAAVELTTRALEARRGHAGSDRRGFALSYGAEAATRANGRRTSAIGLDEPVPVRDALVNITCLMRR